MENFAAPFSVPPKLEADLASVHAYWEGLKRRDASMPFWDDVNLASLPDLSGRLMLIDAFEKPLRFRFGVVGEELNQRYGANVDGKFSDEIKIHLPFQYFNSQCVATIEIRAATYYRHLVASHGGSRAEEEYSRLLLPMWGDGHIGMLLGAVAWG